VVMASNLADWPDHVKAKWPLDKRPAGLFSGRMNKPFGQAVIDAMKARGWSVAELERQSGVSYDVINKFKHRPQASTSAENAQKLAAALDLDWGPAAPEPPATVLVPIYDIEVSAGNGVIPGQYEEIAGQLSFPPGYLRHITSTSVRHLAIVTVQGDSMAPTLHPRDVVLIDTTKTSLGYDGLFVLRMDGALHIKRINRGTRPGIVRIVSDNDDRYPPFERALDEVEAVGKVLWYGRKE
jgi:phage repressor protein C with HTH and peptisase S24 domain